MLMFFLLKAQVSAGLCRGPPAEGQIPLEHFVRVCDGVIRAEAGQCVCAGRVERELPADDPVLQNRASLKQKPHKRPGALNRH